MFASELKEFIDQDKKMSKAFQGFRGFNDYPSNIFKQDGKLKAVILNPKFDEKDQVGHWVLLCVDPQRKCVTYFDPLGESPTNYTDGEEARAEWLEAISAPSFRSNIGFQYQSDKSSSCGLFVLYTFYFLSRGYKFQQILSHFSVYHRNRNEKIVQRFSLRFKRPGEKNKIWHR